MSGCTNGKYGSQRYFTCKGNRALFVPVTKCSPDSRFISSTTGSETAKATPTPPGVTPIVYWSKSNVHIQYKLSVPFFLVWIYCACLLFSVPPFEESEEDVPPIPESKALSLLVGRMKGIQGHINSCYLDATLFR